LPTLRFYADCCFSPGLLLPLLAAPFPIKCVERASGSARTADFGFFLHARGLTCNVRCLTSALRRLRVPRQSPMSADLRCPLMWLLSHGLCFFPFCRLNSTRWPFYRDLSPPPPSTLNLSGSRALTGLILWFCVQYPRHPIFG